MTQMILRSSALSPFGRKVVIAAHANGLMDRIAVKPAVTTDPDDTLRGENPLGKVPTLILADGTTLYDSRVIAEYLDHVGTGALFPSDPDRRFAALRLQALADGLMDAGILRVYESRFRPDALHHQPWLDYQAEKMERGIEKLNAAPPPTDIDIGTVALACALDWFDVRFEGVWRAGHPALVEWFDTIVKNIPAFNETSPKAHI